MKNSIGLGLAIAATTSFAIAGGGEGEGEKKKATNVKKNPTTLEKMAVTPTPVNAGLSATPGEGITITAGDDFSLNLINRVQARYRYSNLENDTTNAAVFTRDTSNFSIPAARTIMEGHVWDESMRYRVQLDWSSSSVLLDGWFDWHFMESDDSNNTIGLRFGQQKPHHGREYQGEGGFLEHTGRSLASRTFTGNRVVGAYVHGHHMEGNKLHWWAGAVNNDPAIASAALESGNGAANTDNELNFIAHVSFDPWGDFGDEWFAQGDLEKSEEFSGTFGVGVMVGNHQTSLAPGAADVETVSVTGNFGMKFKGVHALVEGFLRSDDPDTAGSTESDAVGFAAGGSYTLPARAEGGSQWSFAGRYSMITLDNSGAPMTPALLTATPLTGIAGSVGTGDVSEIELTVSNYYKAHRLKTQVGYRFQAVEPDGTAQDLDNHFIDILFQWMF